MSILPIAGGRFKHRSAGLTQPPKNPRVHYRFPSFLIPGRLDPSRPTLIYVADRNTNGASPRFRSLTNLQRADHRFQFFSLLFFASILSLAVYNFSVFIWLRDSSYLYYVGKHTSAHIGDEWIQSTGAYPCKKSSGSDTHIPERNSRPWKEQLRGKHAEPRRRPAARGSNGRAPGGQSWLSRSASWTLSNVQAMTSA